MKKNISRRKMIQSLSLGMGTMALDPFSQLFLPKALAQSTSGVQAHLCLVYLDGGLSASFNCADLFLNTPGFGGINSNNIIDLGNDLFVHNSFDSFPSFVKENMATAGIVHGQSSHNSATSANFGSQGNLSSLHYLANLMGGPGAIKLASAGRLARGLGFSGNVDGVSYQVVNGLDGLLSAFQDDTESNPYMPNRVIGANSLKASFSMSDRELEKNPESLSTLNNSYGPAIETLSQATKSFNIEELMADYSLSSSAVSTESFASQLACAELMFLSGTNVVSCANINRDLWDNHRDPTQRLQFRGMQEDIVPQLEIFFRRVYGDAEAQIPPLEPFRGKNIVTVIMGDFIRKSRNSGHGVGACATVIGKNVKVGTSASLNSETVFSQDAGNVGAFWSYIGRVLGLPDSAITELVGVGGPGSAQGLQLHESKILKI